MKRTCLVVLIVIVSGLASITALIACLHKTSPHISILYPELSSVDSCYIEGRGFPGITWVHNDPSFSGRGKVESKLFVSGIIENCMLSFGVWFTVMAVTLIIGVLWQSIMRIAGGRT